MAVIAASRQTNVSDICPTFPSNGIAITASDADTFERPVTVYAGATGSVTIKPAGDPSKTLTFATVLAGQPVPCLAIAVMATGTTATGLIGVY